MAEQYCPDKTDVRKDAVSIQAYQWHTYWTSSWKKTKGSSYIHQEAFVTDVEMNEKSSGTVAVMVPWNLAVIVDNVS